MKLYWKTPFSLINTAVLSFFKRPDRTIFSCTFAPMLKLKQWTLSLWFLAMVWIFPACNEPDLIGLDLQPASESPEVDYDTLDVDVYTVPEDSLIMWSTLKNLIELPLLFLGSYDDPYAGKTFAGFVNQVRIGNTITSTTFAGATTPDSVVLSYLYRDQNGDTTQMHHISVYELNEDLAADSVYYSNRVYSRSTFLGHIDLVPNIDDSVDVGGTKKAPQLRIPLDTALGGKFMREYINTPATFASNAAFMTFFKGVVLVDSVDGQGNITSFTSTSGVHRLTLYFSGNKSYEFIIDVNAVRVSYFVHEYLPANLDQVKDNEIIVQSMAGLKDSIVIQNLPSLYANGPVAISSAKLVFLAQTGTVSNNFTPHSNLLVFGSDSLGRNITTADASEPSSYYGGSFDDTYDSYTFNVARYVQQTLKKVVEDGGKDYGLFLVAGGSTSNARRSVLKGQGSVKLIVTTTKINP